MNLPNLDRPLKPGLNCCYIVHVLTELIGYEPETRRGATATQALEMNAPEQ